MTQCRVTRRAPGERMHAQSKLLRSSLPCSTLGANPRVRLPHHAHQHHGNGHKHDTDHYRNHRTRAHGRTHRNARALRTPAALQRIRGWRSPHPPRRAAPATTPRQPRLVSDSIVSPPADRAAGCCTPESRPWARQSCAPAKIRGSQRATMGCSVLRQPLCLFPEIPLHGATHPTLPCSQTVGGRQSPPVGRPVRALRTARQHRAIHGSRHTRRQRHAPTFGHTCGPPTRAARPLAQPHHRCSPPLGLPLQPSGKVVHCKLKVCHAAAARRRGRR